MTWKRAEKFPLPRSEHGKFADAMKTLQGGNNQLVGACICVYDKSVWIQNSNYCLNEHPAMQDSTAVSKDEEQVCTAADGPGNSANFT